MIRSLRSALVTTCLAPLLLPISFRASAQQASNNSTAAIAIPSRITAKIDESHRISLPGTVHPLASTANDRGLLPDSTPLTRMQVVLKRSDAQESTLRQFIEDAHNPVSPKFHQWLTPEQFGKQFGPSDADVAALTTWLANKGFNVTHLNPGRQTLEFEGTSGQFRSAFHTEIHKYAVAGGTHYANNAAPQIPAALAPVFGGFASLNNFPPRSPAVVNGKASYNPQTHASKPDWTIGSNSAGFSFPLAPADFAVQYDLNPLYSAGTNGAGQTVAVINISNVDVYLVNQYRKLFGLPTNPLQVIIDGTDPGQNGINNPGGPNGWETEAYLDVEMVSAVAPQATVDLVIAGETALSDGMFLAAEHAVYNNIAPVMSLSVEACEHTLGANNQFLNSLWQQAAAQGITVVVAASDSGSAGCDDFDTQDYAVQGQAVNGYASTPYNVAVGGTDFYYSDYATGGSKLADQLAGYWTETASNNTPVASIKGFIPEQPWNDSQYGLNPNVSASNIVAGSGGPSTCGIPTVDSTGQVTTCAPYPKPSWQVGKGVPADQVRDIPDVSLFAANGYNYSYYPVCIADGDCQPVGAAGTVQISGAGGTSASAPAFAGIMALVNQKYGRQGQADYTLYPLATQFPAAFHDVTVGTNTVPCPVTATSSIPLDCIPVANPQTVTDPVYGTAVVGEIGTGTTAEYNAGVGYDLATGLGTIDATVLLADWNKITFTGTTTTLTPSSTSFTHGTAVTFSGSVTSSGSAIPTGSVALMTTSATPNNLSETTFPLTSGSFSNSVGFLPGGTYTVYGRYSGDPANASSSSAPVSITVTSESSATALEAIYQADLTATNYSLLSNGNSINYGTTLDLEGLPAPTAEFTAYINCKLGGGTCPSFTFPTGGVSFTDGSTALGTMPLNSNGEAYYAWVAPVGAHSVTAAYSGDASYGSSSAVATTFTVVKNTPTVTVSESLASLEGGPSLLSFQIENSVATNAKATAPTGTLIFSGGPSNMPSLVTLTPAIDPSNGVSEGIGTVLLPANTPAGNYTLTFSYSGDPNYNALAAEQLPFTLQPASAGAIATTIAASISAPASTPASPVLLTVTVTAQSGSSAPPGGIVIYSDGAILPVTSPLPVNSGLSVTYTIPLSSTTLFNGANVLTVQYPGGRIQVGSPLYLASATTVALNNSLTNFSMVPATTVLTAATGTTTDAINLASLNGFAGPVALTCTATGGITCSLSPTSVTLAAGGTGSSTLSLDTSAATSGTQTVVITGTDSTGQYIHTLGLTINVPFDTFKLGAASSIVIPTQGMGGSTGLSVTSTGIFSGAVNLTCSVTASPAGAINLPGCSVTPTITLSMDSAVSATLSITTTAQTTGALAERPATWLAGGTALTSVLLCLLLPVRRRRWTMLAMALASVLLLGNTLGCGGSIGSLPPTTGTTLGNYTVTVTGTDAVTGKIRANVPVAVTVN